jgi:hypothetical protein
MSDDPGQRIEHTLRIAMKLDAKVLRKREREDPAKVCTTEYIRAPYPGRNIVTRVTRKEGTK